MIIDPHGMTVTEWCDQMVDELQSSALVPKLLDPTAWKQWAFSLVGLPAVSRFNPPNPFSYGDGPDDWMVWADDFNRTSTLEG